MRGEYGCGGGCASSYGWIYYCDVNGHTSYTGNSTECYNISGNCSQVNNISGGFSWFNDGDANTQMYLYADYGMNWFSAYNWCKKEGEYQGRPLRLPTKEEALSIDMQNRISSLWDSYNAIWTSTDANGLGENVNGCSKYTVDTGGSVGTAAPMDNKRVLCVSESYTPRVCPSGSVGLENQCGEGLRVTGTVNSNVSNAPCYTCGRVPYGCNGGCASGKYCRITSYNTSGECNDSNSNFWTDLSGSCYNIGSPRVIQVSGVGTVYLSTNANFNWWSSYNWCVAQGKRLLTYDEANNNMSALAPAIYRYNATRGWTASSSPQGLGDGSCNAQLANYDYSYMWSGPRDNWPSYNYAVCVD